MAKGNRWEDHYTRRARDEKWRARSVYKLEEIDKRFKIIRRGDHILDLGCYPGSWLQYSIKRVGPRGNVVGVDLQEPECFSAHNFRFIEADVLELDPGRLAAETGPIDVILSDLAPRTTGIRVTDASRSMELAKRAMEIALILLKKNGHFLCKVFEGKDLRSFRGKISSYFSQVRLIRPSAIRKGSREIYLLGQRLTK